MAPRSSWKGFLKLSLVSVPVKAFTAHNTSEEIRLNQLHRSCNARVRYKKVCPEHGDLQQKDIVSGYEYAKDQYVVIDPQELSKLRTESDRSVRIAGFVPADSVPPIFLAGKTYYLLPDGVAGKRPYTLLTAGMRHAGVVAVAQVIMTGREQLVLVRPDDELLTMSILHYPKKVKDTGEFLGELDDQETTKEERQLADTLIQASTLEDFDIAAFKDDYVEKLTQLIQMKIDGEEVVQAPDHEEPKILNLMEALKQSVEAAQTGTERKMAPSKKTRTKKKAARKKKSG